MSGPWPTWWLWVQDPVEANFLSSVFSLLTSAEACERGSRWLWKERCVITGVRKPGNTCASLTVYDLTVKVALNQIQQQQSMLSDLHVTHYHTMSHFDTLKMYSCWKGSEKRSNFSFFSLFSTLDSTHFSLEMYFKMSAIWTSLNFCCLVMG